MSGQPATDPQSCCDGAGDLGAVGNDDVVRALATAGFAALWRGDAARPYEFVPAAPDDADAVAAELARRGRAELDADGRLVGIHGLTLRSSRHWILHDGVVHRTWCAFDAIGIPAALRLDATAYTDCPVCRRSLRVPIARGAASRHVAVLWLPESPGRNLLADFCAKADLFCSREHLAQQMEPRGTRGRVVDIAGAADLGRATWADVQHLGIP